MEQKHQDLSKEITLGNITDIGWLWGQFESMRYYGAHLLWHCFDLQVMPTIENKFTRIRARNFSCPIFSNGSDGSS